MLDPQGRPVPSAGVSTGAAGSSPSDSTKTDSAGRYLLRWNGGTYLIISVMRIGFIPASIYIANIAAAGDTLQRDIRLSPIPSEAAPSLKTVVVTSHRRTPSGQTRETAGETRTGEFGFILDGQPITPGDLGEIGASLAPGVLRTGSGDESTSGISIAGQPQAANHTAVDGSSYGSSSLPPEAIASAAVAVNDYDASRGQFTGGELTATTRSGTNLWGGALRGSLAPAAFKYGEGGRSAFSQPTGTRQVDGGGGGAIVPDQLFVYGAFTASRRTGPAPFLDANNIDELLALGVSPDSVRQFVNAANALGVPTRIGAIPIATSDVGSAIARVDYAAGERHLLTLRFDGRSAEFSKFGASPLTLLAGDGQLRSTSAGIQGIISSHFDAVQHDLRFYTSHAVRRSTAALSGPAARIFTTNDNDQAGLATVQFGGDPLGLTDVNRDFVEVADELAATPGRGNHLWKLGALFNRDRVTSPGGSNSAGTFTFGSVAGFAANEPILFTRGLGQPQEATVNYGALYAGDTWTPQEGLQFTLGERLERSWYPDVQPPAVVAAAAFGTADAHVHAEQRLLPRLGVTYRNVPGNFDVRAGIGEFRGTIPASALSAALAQRGTESSLDCVGAAAPIPNWALYTSDPAATPSACADGTSIFSGQQPGLTLFSPSFGAPLSRRASLDFDWIAKGAPIFFHARATLVRGSNEAIAFDRNLDDRAKFTLSTEGGRPVYVPAAAIDPNSGGVSLTSSRLDPAFGTVREITSGGRSAADQVSVDGEGIMHWFGSLTALSVSYTFTQSRDVSTGVGALGGYAPSTAGDPMVQNWSAQAFEQRHVVQVSAMHQVTPAVSLVFIGRLTSGVPFTPMVEGDVNGDGLYNDRAFVFDPTTTRDTSVARAMTQLLRTAPASVRDCLNSQLGRVAGPSSCRTAWSPWLDMQANVRPWKFGSSEIGLTFRAQNLTAGMDYLLHGANGLHGWGQFPFPDNTLLKVRGFDPATQSFRYDVNQAFGSVGTARTVRTPFILTIQARVTFSTDPARQVMAGVIAAARSSHRTPDELRVIVAKRFPNVPAQTLLLARRLQLGLTNDQATSLGRMADSLTPPLDSLIGAMADMLAGKTAVNSGGLQPLVTSAKVLADRGRNATQSILTLYQWDKLPDALRAPSTGEPVRPSTRFYIPNP
ncbi:MAG: TonB-dependent receptor [Gemmatimonadaceae bacterium]